MIASIGLTADTQEPSVKAAPFSTHRTFGRAWSGAIEAGRPRFDCLSIVRDSTFATLCSRSCYGDVTFHRLTIEEWCNDPRDFLRQSDTCGPVAATRYDQLWLLDESGTDPWHVEKRKELLEHVAASYSRASVHYVGLPVLESAFEMPAERIAKLTRKGAFGNLRDLTLSNLDGLALGLCVFAQQFAGGTQ